MGQRYEVNIKKRKEILATCLSESILPKIKNALVDTRDFLVLVGTQQNTALSEHFQNPVEAKSIPLTHKYMTSHLPDLEQVLISL